MSKILRKSLTCPAHLTAVRLYGNKRHPEFIIIDFYSTDDDASGTSDASCHLKSRPASLRQKDLSHSAEISALSSNRVKNSEKKDPVSESTRALFGRDETCYIIDAKFVGNTGRYFNVRIVLNRTMFTIL